MSSCENGLCTEIVLLNGAFVLSQRDSVSVQKLSCLEATGVRTGVERSVAPPFVPPPIRAHEVSQLVGDIQVGLRNLVFAEIPLPQSVIAAMGKLDELLLEMSTYSESWEE